MKFNGRSYFLVNETMYSVCHRCGTVVMGMDIFWNV